MMIVVSIIRCYLADFLWEGPPTHRGLANEIKEKLIREWRVPAPPGPLLMTHKVSFCDIVHNTAWLLSN